MPALPLYLQKGFNKKRIDHRHHAMDAIVIACANRNIVNYLNNSSARKNSEISRYDLQRLLCEKVKTDANGNYKWILRKPWETFTQDVYAALTSKRSYRDAFSPEVAMEMLIDEVKNFDMKIFLAFQRTMHEEEKEKEKVICS